MQEQTAGHIIWKKRIIPVLIGLGLMGLFLMRPVRKLLVQAALAALLSSLSLPLCRLMEKKLKRKTAALLSITATILAIAGVIMLALPQLISRFTALIGQLPGLFSTMENIWLQLCETELFSALNLNRDLPGQWLQAAGKYIAQEVPKVLGLLAGSVDALSRAFLSPVLGYYFLRDREIFSYQLSLWIPAAKRKTVLKMLRQMKREAGSYLRGQMMICLCVMGLTALLLMILGIPSFLTLGILMGICEWIPYVGPLIGGVPIVLFSLPFGWKRTLWAIGAVIAVQQVEGVILSPRLMSGAVSIHPVYVLLLLSFGGLVGGLWGMMAVLPLFVCIRGAIKILYVEKQPDKLVKNSGKDIE